MADSRAERKEQQTHEIRVPGIGALIAGKYRVEGQLGSGGMGVVLSARNEALGQRVAIKFLVVGDEQYRTTAAERLLREARAAAALRGEHVVRVYDVGEHDAGAPFIVMEHLEGEDLGKILRKVGKLAVSDAAALIVQACRAVAEAHAAGIVHRDLKPSNLFVVRHPDGSATIKVVDFGIAKSTRMGPIGEQTLTTEKTALGSPHYMSPEQVRDSHDVDSRTDVWSLGVILYELLAGRPAFQASTFSGVFAAIAADTPPSVSSLRPEVPPALEQLLVRCLERDPARRFQSAEELVSALWPFAAREVDFVRLTRDFTSGPTGELPEPSGPRTAQPETVPIGLPEPTKAPTDTQVSPGAPGAFEPTSISGVARSFEAGSPLLTATQRSPLVGEEQSRHARRRALTALALLSLFGLIVWLVTRASPRTDDPRGKTAAPPAASASPSPRSVDSSTASAGPAATAAGPTAASAAASVAPVQGAPSARKSAAKGAPVRASASAASVEDPEIRLTR